MRTMSWPAMLGRYVCQCRGAIGACALCGGIFALVCWLYGTPWEAVAYGAALCLLGGGAILLGGFFRFMRKRRERLAAFQALPLGADIPAADTLEGEEFRAMAAGMQRAYEELMTRRQTERQESQDYYATWVH